MVNLEDDRRKITVIFLPSLDRAKRYHFYCSTCPYAKYNSREHRIFLDQDEQMNKRIYNFFYNFKMYHVQEMHMNFIYPIRYLLLLCLSLLESTWTLAKTQMEGIWVLINCCARWQMPAVLHSPQTARNTSWILSKREKSILQCFLPVFP